MGQGKAGDSLLVCKCHCHVEGNKAVMLSEIKVGMCLSRFCRRCAAGEDVTWGAQHPGDVLVLVLQKGGRAESSGLCGSPVFISDAVSAC